MRDKGIFPVCYGLTATHHEHILIVLGAQLLDARREKDEDQDKMLQESMHMVKKFSVIDVFF